MKRYSEDNLQASCHVWFHNNYCLLTHNPRLIGFAVPNGGFRNSFEASKLKSTGTVSGVADYVILMPEGKTVFIEFKLPNGVQSETQKRFESTATALGFQYHIIRSFEQFKELIYKIYDTNN